MNKEDLLKDRWKVIADYPGSDYHIGEILDRDWGWVGDDEVGFKHKISHYPHLFKKLKWWEEMDVNNMPEYVKIIADGCSIPQNTIVKVLKFDTFPDEGKNWGNEGEPFALLEVPETTATHDKGELSRIHVIHLYPSDEQEYKEYSKPK